MLPQTTIVPIGRLFHRVTAFAGLTAIGFFLIAYWFRGDFPQLLTISPSPTAGLCAVLFGATLWWRDRHPGVLSIQILAWLSGGALAVTAVDYVFSLTPTYAVFRPPVEVASAIFIPLMLAVVALLIDAPKGRDAAWRNPLIAWLSLSAVLLAFTNLVIAINAYAFDLTPHSMSEARPVMICLTLLCATSLILSESHNPCLNMLYKRSAAGIIFRRLFATLLLLPAFLVTFHITVDPTSWLLLPNFLITSAVAAYILSVAAMIIAAANSAGQLEARQQEAEAKQRDLAAELQRHAEQLQLNVAERTRELEQTNHRLRFALRGAGFGVAEWDQVSGRITHDEGIHTIYGTTPETFPETVAGWLERVHPDDKDITRQAHERVQQGKEEELMLNYRILTDELAVRHIETLITSAYDQEGHRVGTISLDRDVTAQREAEHKLNQTHDRLQFALTASGYGVWEFNLLSHELVWDDSMFELHQITREEFKGTLGNWLLCVHPEDRALTTEQIAKTIAGQQSTYAMEFRVVWPSGEVRHIHVRGQLELTKMDSPLRLIGLCRDITAEKTLAQRLAREEEMVSEMSRLARIGAWEIDLKTHHIAWTPLVYQIHEVEAETYEPTLESTFEFYAPDDRKTYQAAINAAIKQGHAFDLELPLKTAKDRTIWVRILGHAQCKEGHVIRVYGALQDVTVRHESEAEHRKLESELAQAHKMDTLGALASGIAHDFNNLLTGIIGYHELAADTVPEDNPAHECLVEAYAASNRARDLVAQILAFSYQHSDHERTVTNLIPVMEEAKGFLRASIPSSTQIELEIAPECPQVRIDSTQLLQVLINLGANAGHAMKDRNGHIALRAEPQELDLERTGALGLGFSGVYVCILVEDTGHGMKRDTTQHIFDPFFTTKPVGEGTGIGMSVIKNIVQTNCGAIEVESELGVGTTVRIYLPAATSNDIPVEIPPPESTSSPSTGAGERILILDDEHYVREFIRISLSRLNYDVQVVESAEECIETIKQDPSKWNLLITDQTMPDLTGMELIAQIREVTTTLPALLMSGSFSANSREESEKLGGVTLISKPFTAGEIAATIRRLFHPGVTTK